VLVINKDAELPKSNKCYVILHMTLNLLHQTTLHLKNKLTLFIFVITQSNVD